MAQVFITNALAGDSWLLQWLMKYGLKRSQALPSGSVLMMSKLSPAL
jgi:hypothetical protein